MDIVTTICLVIGCAIVLFGGVKVVLAVIKAEKEIKKHNGRR